MSNILNLKGVKFLAIIVLAVAILATFGMVAVQKASADCSINSTLRVGSRGPEVVCLQTSLGGLTADGSFGPKTKAAVVAFQANSGLVADGIFGPLSRAVWMNNAGNSANFPSGCTSASGFSVTTGLACYAITSFPPGCNSNSGFSPTTGLSCSGGGSPGLPAGCTSTSGFSPTTGMACNGGGSPNLPAGCTSTSGFSPTTGNRCDGGTTPGSGNNNNLSGGETSISSVNVNDADDDTIGEGANKTAVAEIEFDVDDADATLERADIVFQAENSADEEDAWKVFDTVYLLDGSRVVASVSADDDSAWEDSDDSTFTGTSQASRIRFNNIDEDFQEGDTAFLTVAVDVASSVDGADLGATWTVGIEDDGLRFTDGAGLTSVAASSDTASFTIEEAGAQSDFNVTKASSSPTSTTLEVKETTSSTQTIAIFKVDTDEDGNDVKINDFPVTITVAAAGGGTLFSDVVDDVFVVLDGTEYSADQAPEAIAVAGDGIQTFTFDDIDDDDVVVAAGDDTTVTVKVKFHSQGAAAVNYDNGTSIFASALLTASDIEDADTGDDVDDLDGTADGETMTLAGTGLMVEVNSATTSIAANDDAGVNDGATFKFNVDITAFGDDDIYINRNNPDIVATGTVDADINQFFTIERSNSPGGTALGAVSGTIADNTDADEVIGDSGAYGAAYNGELFYRLSDGETETFTITITATNAGEAKQVRAFLTSIEFTTDNVVANDATHDALAASSSSYTANLAEDSQSPFQNIQ